LNVPQDHAIYAQVVKPKGALQPIPAAATSNETSDHHAGAVPSDQPVQNEGAYAQVVKPKRQQQKPPNVTCFLFFFVCIYLLNAVFQNNVLINKIKLLQLSFCFRCNCCFLLPFYLFTFYDVLISLLL